MPPPPGHMSLTIVGSGTSTAIPVIGHIGTDCACRDAIANPNGPNRRSNVSLLITTTPTPPGAQASPPLLLAGGVVDGTPNEAVMEKEDEDKEKAGFSHRVFASAHGNTINDTPVHLTLIDCGKTFRDAYFRILVGRQVRLIDALLLTHDHADAVAGLDDLRDLQRMHMVAGTDNWMIDSFVPTYLLGSTLATLTDRVGYIVRNSHVVGRAAKDKAAHEALMAAHVTGLKREKGEDGWNVIGIRRSTALQFFTLPEKEVIPFYVPALGGGRLDSDSATDANSHLNGGGDGGVDDCEAMPMYAVPVEHGEDYVSLGFVFGRGVAFKNTQQHETQQQRQRVGSCVAYISDVSGFPAASVAFLESLVRIDVLILDCLHGPGAAVNAVHFNMDEAVACVAHLKPRRAVLIGMYCDVEHEAGQRALAGKLSGLVSAGVLELGEVESIELGYDGMEIVLPQ